MLILTRRVGESLMVGDDVTITVLGVKGNQVRIGVNAPKDVGVHREEIYQRIQREKLAKLQHLESSQGGHARSGSGSEAGSHGSDKSSSDHDEEE